MTRTNAEIARLFDNLADLLEMKRELVFKIRSYRRVAEVARGLHRSLEEMVLQHEELRTIPGIGEAITAKVQELVNTGRVETYEREKAAFPPLFDLLVEAGGLRPQVAWRAIQEAGASSPEELARVIDDGGLAWLPATGEGSLCVVRDSLDAVTRVGSGNA